MDTVAAKLPKLPDSEKIQQSVKEELVKRDIDAVKIVRKYDSKIFGLFTPWPSYPPQEHTLDSIIKYGIPRCVLLFVMTFGMLIGASQLLFALNAWMVVTVMAVPLGYGGYKKITREKAAGDGAKTLAERDMKWSEHPKEFFTPDSPAAQLRRFHAAEEVIASAKPQEATTFNEHIKGATSLAVYGCGILAAGHVGGLRALEKHGLRYDNLKTLAGVSAGSVVVACVAVGYKAEELFELIQKLPFYRLAIPELGSLLRIVGVLLMDVVKFFAGPDVAATFEPLARGSGPGVNSGKALYDMVGDALKEKTGDPNITLKEVQDRFKKRLVILVCELDSGKEVHLTPESHPFLPVRAAVRMSMGVPGLMEPFEYNGHYYCDGGMCNDFPMNALPDDGHRLGLMIRPLDWIEYNYGGIPNVTAQDQQLAEELQKWPKVQEYMQSYKSKTKDGLWSVRSPIDLALTSVSVMMDANLLLQVKGAMAKRGPDISVTDLAPEILTVCGGRLDPFDFMLSKEQHRDLYCSGQLSVHLHSTKVDKDKSILSEENHLKALLFFLHMDPPKV